MLDKHPPAATAAVAPELVPEVTDPSVAVRYALMANRMESEGTLGPIIQTYRECVRFNPHHRMYCKEGFHDLDRFLTWPATPRSEGLVAVKFGDMIDTRTNMSVCETLRMLKVHLRHQITGEYRVLE